MHWTTSTAPCTAKPANTGRAKNCGKPFTTSPPRKSRAPHRRKAARCRRCIRARRAMGVQDMQQCRVGFRCRVGFSPPTAAAPGGLKRITAQPALRTEKDRRTIGHAGTVRTLPYSATDHSPRSVAEHSLMQPAPGIAETAANDAPRISSGLRTDSNVGWASAHRQPLPLVG